MWYILILYFVLLFLYKMWFEEIETDSDITLNIFGPIIGIAIAAILGILTQ